MSKSQREEIVRAANSAINVVGMDYGVVTYPIVLCCLQSSLRNMPRAGVPVERFAAIVVAAHRAWTEQQELLS